jgi:hypothetical protein
MFGVQASSTRTTIQSKKGNEAMKYRIGAGGFPLPEGLIPSSTVINTDTVSDGWSAIIAARGIMPPVNAQALDDATYQWMVGHYPNRVGPWPIAGQ